MPFNTNVYALAFSDSMIFAASSHGLYVYGNPVISGLKAKERVNNLYTLYPNPVSSGVVTLKTSSEGEYVVRVLDLNGRLLLSKNSSKKELRLSVGELQNGMYIVVIQKGKHIEHKKLLLNR